MFEIDSWLVVAQIINFSILFFIFKKFVSDSMIDLVDERKTLLDRLYKADIYYDEKVKSADTKSEQIIQDAHNQAKQFFDQSKEITSQTIQNLIEKANVEVKYILESWKNKVEKERVEMLEELEEDAIDLSIKLNKKLFSNASSNKSFVDKQTKK